MTDEDASPLRDDAAQPGVGAAIANAIGARNLMIIIITMPLVFLIVVMATLAIFGRPGGDTDGVDESQVVSASAPATLVQPDAAPPELTGVTPPSPAALTLDPAPLMLPAGADITSMALDANRLAVRVENKDGGGEIVVYDLASGAPVQRIKVVPQISPGGDDL